MLLCLHSCKLRIKITNTGNKDEERGEHIYVHVVALALVSQVQCELQTTVRSCGDAVEWRYFRAVLGLLPPKRSEV